MGCHWEAASLSLSLLLLSFLVLNCFPAAGSTSPVLDPAEVISLKEIAKKLGKTNWNFDVDPCSGVGNWKVLDDDKGFESGVDCDCSFLDGTRCHITSMFIKGENLSGTLPPEFGQLRHLLQLDLSRNVINGSIPREWSSMKLQGLSIMGNRLSGPFPEALTKITTLSNLSIENNLFSGLVPPDIGSLVNMEKLCDFLP